MGRVAVHGAEQEKGKPCGRAYSSVNLFPLIYSIALTRRSSVLTLLNQKLVTKLKVDPVKLQIFEA